MGFEQVVIALAMACVVASLISIVLYVVLFIVTGTSVSVKTAINARRARRAPYLRQLSRWCSVSELAEIDQALDRTLAEERGARLGLPGR